MRVVVFRIPYSIFQFHDRRRRQCRDQRCEYGMTAAAIVPKLLVVAVISLLLSTVGIALILRLVLFGDSSVGCPSTTSTTTTLASPSLVSSEFSGGGTSCSSLLLPTTPSSEYSSLQEGDNDVVIARFTSSVSGYHRRHYRGKVIGTNFNAADVSM